MSAHVITIQSAARRSSQPRRQVISSCCRSYCTISFLAFDAEIRTVVCSTNAIESVNARIRRAVRSRGHLPNEAAALKCLYLAVMSLDPTGQGRRRWIIRWNPALNAFEIPSKVASPQPARNCQYNQLHRFLDGPRYRIV
jgi:transposase-like protein